MVIPGNCQAERGDVEAQNLTPHLAHQSAQLAPHSSTMLSPFVILSHCPRVTASLKTKEAMCPKLNFQAPDKLY
jgi:hypothetical protein